MRFLAVATAAVVTCGVVSRASAEQPPQPGNTALNWSRLPGAEACPGVAELATRVAAHLKRDAFVSPSVASVLIDASIEPGNAQGFRVRITLSSRDEREPGRRDIESPSPECGDAVDAAALAIALMIDPNALALGDEVTEPSTAPAAEPSEAPKTVPAPATPAPVAAARVVATPSNVETRDIVDQDAARDSNHSGAPGLTRFGLSGVGTGGQLPHAGYGVLVGIRQAARSRHWGVDVDASYLTPQRQELRSDVGGEFSLAALGLSGFWLPVHEGATSISLLAGAQVGQLSASGFGFTPDRRASSWLISTTAQAEAAFAISTRWDMLVRVEAGLPVWRDTFEVVNPFGTTSIFRPAPVFAALSAGIAFSP